MWLRGLRSQHSVCEDAGSIPGLAQQFKDLALSLQGYEFNPWPHSVGECSCVAMAMTLVQLQMQFNLWPRNFHIPPVLAIKGKKK